MKWKLMGFHRMRESTSGIGTGLRHFDGATTSAAILGTRDVLHTSTPCPPMTQFRRRNWPAQRNPHMRLTPVKIAVLDGDLVVTLPEGNRERTMREKVGVDQVVGAR